MKPYSMMIGRFQPWHDGHLWLLREILYESPDSRAWIAVRDIDVDEKNPYHPAQVVENIKREVRNSIPPYDYEHVLVSVIPDIEGIHYGRGVGWRIVEHIPPEGVGEISATKIRAGK